jgi:predicted DsbA family dithiol-disulfide isomerase
VLTLFHDYTSPASAVAAFRLQRLADEGLPVELVGFEAIGVDVVLPVTLDVTAAVDALAAAAAEEGLQLRLPQALPPTVRAHVLEDVAQGAGLGASWRQCCYRAFWEDGANIAEPTVLLDLAVTAGLGRQMAEVALADRSRVTAARRRTAAHRAEGVGGVPTILAHRTLVPGLLDEADLRTLAAL